MCSSSIYHIYVTPHQSTENKHEIVWSFIFNSIHTMTTLSSDINVTPHQSTKTHTNCGSCSLIGVSRSYTTLPPWQSISHPINLLASVREGDCGCCSSAHQTPAWSPVQCGSAPWAWRWSVPCCRRRWACSSSPDAGGGTGHASHDQWLVKDQH